MFKSHSCQNHRKVASPHAVPMNSEQIILVHQEIEEMLKKGAIKPAHSFQKELLSLICLVRKKNLGQIPVLNLKKWNQNIPFAHLKMEGFFLLKELLREYDYVCKLGLKDACFSVPLNPESQKFISFTWNGKIY